MKKIYLILIALFTTLLSSNLAQASHVMGADFEYQCLGKDSFYITVKVYKDCKGVNLSPIALTITPLSAGCSWSTSASMTQVSCEDITPVCKKSCSKCDRQNCNAYGYPNGSNAGCAFQYGMEKLTFKYLLVFPSSINSKCCKFRASYEQCCRNGQITTCCAGDNFFSYAEFDRCVKPCNSSPVLANDPVAILCAGNCICLNNGARDTANFDSISYSLSSALAAFGTPTTYNSPYTAVPGKPGVNSGGPLQYKGFPKYKPNPAQQCSGFVLDSVTGDLCFTPTIQQVGVIAIDIIEWRRDSITGKMVKIGLTRRDMQIIIMANCTNKPPVIKGPFSQIVCANDLVCFTDMQITDPDMLNGAQKDSVRVKWNFGIPKATFTKKWNGKNEEWTLCWQTTNKDAPNNSPKTYFFNITAFDDACPIPGQTSRNFSITVKPSPEATRKYTDLGCGLFKLESAPKETYKSAITWTWTVPYPGGTQYNVKDTVHKFSSGGMQFVKHKIEVNGCSSEELDTIIVPPFPEVHLPNDTFMCYGDSMTVTAYSANARPPYKFYLNNDTVGSADSVFLIKSSVDTIIKIKIKDSTNCISNDSMIILVKSLPKINLGPDQRRCTGDSILFDAGTNDSTFNVRSYTWIDSASLSILDTNQYHIEHFDRTMYVKLVDTFSCVYSDTVKSIFNPKVVLTSTDVAACENDSVNIVLTGADSMVVIDIASGDTISYQDSFTYLFNNSTKLAVHGFTTIGGVTCDDWDTVNVTMNFPAKATVKRFPVRELCPDDGIVNFYYTVIREIKTSNIVSGSVIWMHQTDSLVRAAFDTVTGNLDVGIMGATYTSSPPSAPKSRYILFKTITSFGCEDIDSVPIMVHPKPKLVIPAKTFCENNLPYKLNGHATPNAGVQSPDGETWSGTGVSLQGTDWYFNPDSKTGGAGVGRHVITYIYKDNQGYGCSDTDTVSFVVKPVPVITKQYPSHLCNVDGIQDLWQLTKATPHDGVFSGVGIAPGDSMFDPTLVLPLSNIGASPVTVKVVFFVAGNGCPTVDTIPITVYPIPSISLPPSRTICLDSAAWPVPGFDLPRSWWVIDGDSAKSASQVFDPMVWGVGQHNLVYYYTDVISGCSNKDSMSITVQDTPWVAIDPAIPLCAGEPVQLSCKMKNAGGVNWVSSTGGSFYLSGTNTPDNTTLTPVYIPNATDIAQGFFQITVNTTGNGQCNPAVDTMTFFIRPLPVPSFNGLPLDGCSPHQAFFNGFSSEPNCKFDWDFGDPESGTLNNATGDTTSHIFVNNTPDTRRYDIKLKVTTEFLCDSEIVKPQYVASYAIPHADFEPKPTKATVALPRVRFTNLTTFVTDSALYYWKFGDPEFGTSTEKNPTYWYSNTDTGTYIVWLKVVSENNCVDSISKKVQIGPEMTVFIPNAFSPDNAGPKKNNFFWVEADNYKGFEFSIFNRWGEEVFFSKERLPGWNGWFKGKPAQEDVYVYQLNIQNLEGKWFHYNGTVTLLR